MRITAHELKKILAGVWNLPYWATMISDRVYLCPPCKRVERLLRDSYFDRYKYAIDIFDCDDMALMLHAFVRQESYRLRWSHPWPFGELWLARQEDSRQHAVNFCVTQDKGVIICDPQTGIIRNAARTDLVDFIRV